MSSHRWYLHLPADSLRLRLLRTPLVTTRNRARAVDSWWVWGQRDGGRYVLSALSILHRLTGLVVVTPDQEPER